MSTLVLRPVNDLVCGVYTDQGAHVGNLKRIHTVWKFKAVGYDAQGDVLPGGGPLTERHNTVFNALDAAEISRALLASD